MTTQHDAGAAGTAGPDPTGDPTATAGPPITTAAAGTAGGDHPAPHPDGADGAAPARRPSSPPDNGGTGRPPRPGRGGLGGRYYRLLSASTAANVADGAMQVALPLLAAALTRSPALIAALQLAMRLPWLLVALPAGALADRLDRRRTMLAVQLGRTVLLGGLAVAIGLDLASIWLLIAVAFVLGVGETLFDTASQSIMPAVVDRDRLSAANGRLYAAELTANQFIGPPLGGLLTGIAVIGSALAFGTSAGLFALAAALLLTLRGQFRPSRPAGEAPRGLWADVREGVRYLAGHRLLATLGVMTGVQNLAFTAVFSVFVLYAAGPGSAMGLSEAQYGLLLTGFGVGSVLGSLVAARLERLLGRASLLMVALAGGSLTLLVPALTADPIVVGATFVLSAMLTICWNVVTVSLRQRITPDHLLGRVNAGYRVLAWGSMPLGAALGGALAEAFGLRPTFAISGALVLLLLLLRPMVSNARIAAAEAAVDTTGAAGDPAVAQGTGGAGQGGG